ncbi:hypothetical protein BDD12DRAFT_884309 [Trichophaea hybrida]|nr:hypothetical protein BDD12DRAFT_884309 [Trichophaea hybrida]
MLLAQHPTPSSFAPSSRHTRHRPKLSLQIAALSAPSLVPPTPSARTPSSALSPTSRNTFMNRTLTAPTPSPSSSSSSSDDGGSPVSPSLKDKKRRRRYQRRHHQPMKSSHHPTTPSASFMPRAQPERRGRTLLRNKRVGFSEDVVVHIIEDIEIEDANDDSAMEKAREIERLKKWVEDNSPEEEKGMWVRKLVELEMKDMEEQR